MPQYVKAGGAHETTGLQEVKVPYFTKIQNKAWPLGQIYYIGVTIIKNEL
jgi:hypothetical protein